MLPAATIFAQGTKRNQHRHGEATIETTRESGWTEGLLPAGGADQDLLAPSDRDRILQAMSECCAERGYRDTSVAEVIERANVTLADFEALFADKEDCALAAIGRVVSETLTSASMNAVGTGTPAADETDPGESLAGFRSILGLIATRPAEASLGYVQARQGGSPRMTEAYQSGARVGAVMIEQLRGLMTDDSMLPPSAPRATLGGAEALVRRELIAGRAERMPELLPDFVYSVLVGFLGQAEAMRRAELARGLIEAESS